MSGCALSLAQKSADIAEHMIRLYEEVGCPRILQHDRGQEFAGAVDKLMRKLKVHVVRSSAYHPQSQGKIERMHRELKKKMYYDLTRIRNTGVNWVKQLPRYAAVLNENHNIELGKRTPFEVYYGRRKNSASLTNAISTTNGSEFDQMLTFAQMTAFELKCKSIRSAAAKATARCNDLTQKRSLRRHPPTLYVQGDLVLIRCTNVRHKVARKNYVTKGKIIACTYNLHRYKVTFVHLNANRSLRSTKWVPVSNITSLTRAEEKKRKKATLADIQQANARKKFYLPYEQKIELT